jgi:EpsI family protein
MIGRAGIITVLLLAAWAAQTRLAAPAETNSAGSLAEFPTTIGPWIGRDSPLDADVVKVAAVDDYVNRYYQSGSSATLGLYVGYYKSQRQGEALHSPMNCLPGAGWEPVRTEAFSVNMDNRPQTINKLVVERGLDRLLVLYWYQTINRVTASEYLRKIFLVADALGSGRTDVALVRVIAPVPNRAPNAETTALNAARPFAEQILPEVQKRLFR